MCIVIIKPIGSHVPSYDILQNCWSKNFDGAGYMYLRDNEIHIRKGFMVFDEFVDDLFEKQFDERDKVIYHFRLSSGGGVTPENCHPFPLSDNISDLQNLDISTDAALVHNGIIGSSEGNLSDTAVFVRDCLSDPLIKDNLDQKAIQELIRYATDGSRIFILDLYNDVEIKLGDWIYDKEHGLYFSNNDYENDYKKIRKIYSGDIEENKKTSNLEYFSNNDYKNNYKKIRKIYSGTASNVDIEENKKTSIEYCLYCYHELEEISYESFLCSYCQQEFLLGIDGELYDIERNNVTKEW